MGFEGEGGATFGFYPSPAAFHATASPSRGEGTRNYGLSGTVVGIKNIPRSPS